jgi:UDP-N-acetylmuramoyl-tripeptide--D-alanyl-D-alanine ligase
MGELRGVKRRIAVLGDMMELGQFSIQEHERIGKLVPKYADVLVTIGIRSKGMVKGALDAGMDSKNIYEFDNSLRAGKAMQNFIQPGDVLLVKGSQSIRAERLVEEIMTEPEKAEHLLVRQGKTWRNIE